MSHQLLQFSFAPLFGFAIDITGMLLAIGKYLGITTFPQARFHFIEITSIPFSIFVFFYINLVIPETVALFILFPATTGARLIPPNGRASYKPFCHIFIIQDIMAHILND